MAFIGGMFAPLFQGEAAVKLWEAVDINHSIRSNAPNELICLLEINEHPVQNITFRIIQRESGKVIGQWDNEECHVQFHTITNPNQQVLEIARGNLSSRIEMRFMDEQINRKFFLCFRDRFRGTLPWEGQPPKHPQNMPMFQMAPSNSFFTAGHDFQRASGSNTGFNYRVSPRQFPGTLSPPCPPFPSYVVSQPGVLPKQRMDVHPVMQGYEYDGWLTKPNMQLPLYSPEQHIRPNTSPGGNRLLDCSMEERQLPSPIKPKTVQSIGDSVQATTNDNVDPFFGVDLKERDEGAEATLDLLAQAIEAGNVSEARNLVTRLAEKKTKLTIEPLFSAKEREISNIIDLTVYLEDKVSSGGYFTLQVNPADTTIRMLKVKVFARLYFPPEVQRWVVGKRLPKDNELLSQVGVSATHNVVHLYLSSAREAGIQKKEPKAPYEVEKLECTSTRPATVAEEKAQTEQEVVTTPQSRNSMNTLTRGEAALGEITLEGTSFSSSETSTNNTSAPDPPHETVPVDGNIPRQGWNCSQCTLLNKPTRPGCEACGEARPRDYQVPADYQLSEEEKQRILNEERLDHMAQEAESSRMQAAKVEAAENYMRLLATAELRVVPNPEEFECAICFLPVAEGEGVLLRECLHSFCRDCLKMTILASETPVVKCPFRGDNYECNAQITEQEIVQLLDEDEFIQYQRRCISAAERATANSYHCKTPNCVGWCIYEDDVNYYRCEVCSHLNCLTCKAIHEGQSCKDYQDDVRIKAGNDEAAKKTQDLLDKLLSRKEAMKCPHCSIILQKKEGCDWMRCSMCRTEICWATRGPRWGPGGSGDTSGGCKCRVNGTRCSSQCKNCH